MSAATVLINILAVIPRFFKWLLKLFPRVATAIYPLVRWIPSKLNIFIALVLSHFKQIILVLFILSLFAPVYPAVRADRNSTTEYAMGVFNAFGESIARPDSNLDKNIGILKAAEIDDNIQTMTPYVQVIRSLIELIVLVVLGVYFIMAAFTNSSAKGVGTLLVIGIIYGVLVMHYTNDLPFKGLFWGENSLIRNFGLLVNPAKPVYEGYNYLRNTFVNLDLVL
jgi:hypothetical protein